MKAVIYEEYGGPEVFQVREVERPSPKENEVLIKVHCTSINPFEWHHMRGKPLFSRLTTGLFKPKYSILGMDVAGMVEEVGSDVSQFKVGDAVFGYSDYGGLAEYACIKEEKTLLKPEALSFAEVAAIPMAGLTALQSLKNVVQTQPGQTVLINGSSGGVGTYAVQIAKCFGMKVTGVCSTKNVELVKSLGADQVVDYTKENIIERGEQFDIVIDNVGNLSMSDLKMLVKDGGTGIVIGFTTLKNAFPMLVKGKPEKGKIGVMRAKASKEDMLFLLSLMKEGKVKSVLDRYFPLEDITPAMTYLETLHAPGKVLININGNPVEDMYLASKTM